MKVRMQGAIRKWVDHSISVTVNLPSGVDEALVNQLYMEAWQSGCKGCTIYRDGSRSGVMLSVSKKNKEDAQDDEAKDLRQATEIRKPVFQQPPVLETRPKELDCDVVRFREQQGEMGGLRRTGRWTTLRDLHRTAG